MKPYPIMLNLDGRLAVVVGGGGVGRRKAEGLLAAGARVRVVDPAAADVPAGAEHAAEGYQTAHLTGAALVFACTSNRAVNAKVAADAKAAGIPVNVADDPAACDFTVPAFHRTDVAIIAVATSAGIPALAAALRDVCAAALPDQLDAFADALAAIRDRVKADVPESKRREIMQRVCGPEGWEAFSEGGSAALADLSADRGAT